MSTTTDEPPKAQVFNVPNQLTAARLLLSVVVFVLVAFELYLAALIVFTIAASTDWVDGYYARKYNQVTKLGRVFDPFVDKFLICGVFIFLAAEAESGIAPWMAVTVVAREMLVTALRGFIEQSGGDFSAKLLAKWKMLFQCVAAAASLLLLHYTVDAAAPAWLTWTLFVFVWLAIISTLWSGLEYCFAAAKFLRE